MNNLMKQTFVFLIKAPVYLVLFCTLYFGAWLTICIQMMAAFFFGVSILEDTFNQAQRVLLAPKQVINRGKSGIPTEMKN